MLLDLLGGSVPLTLFAVLQMGYYQSDENAVLNWAAIYTPRDVSKYATTKTRGDVSL